MIVSGDVSVDKVCSEALNRVVELVAQNVSGKTLHREVRPVSNLDAVFVLVVLNDVEAILEFLSVKERVKGVATGAQHSGLTLAHT